MRVMIVNQKGGQMEKTWKPTTAGILTIIEGAMRIALGCGIIAGSRWILTLGGMDLSSWIKEGVGMYGPGAADIQAMITTILGVSSTVLLAIGIVLLAFGIIALIGGISAIKRRRWGLALTGSILALPGVLAILAVIFVSIGKKEFK